MSVTVTLTWNELLHAAIEGVRQQVENLEKKRGDFYGKVPGPEDWTLHVEACAAELAVAKHTGRYWTGGDGKLGGQDVAGYMVRSTPRPDGCLLLHDRDLGGMPFVLAVGIAPTFTLVGWCYGAEGQLAKFLRPGSQGKRPCYFVPQAVLRSITTLPLPEEDYVV